MYMRTRDILKIFGSFRARVTLAFLAAIVPVIIANNLLIYRSTVDSQINQLRENLMMVAQTAALMVDGDAVERVPLEKAGMDSEGYKSVAAILRKIKAANPPIRYIYVMKKTDDKWLWRFVVDPEPVSQGPGGRSLTSYPGDPYYARVCPEILKALNEPSADFGLTSDAWGAFLSAYAPVRDGFGKVVAVLGVDATAQHVQDLKKEVYRRTAGALLLAVLFSAFLGFVISRRTTRPVKRLVEATRRISMQQLDYKVDVKGDDEIAELGRAFNSMGHSLYEYKSKLRDYFYRVVQSLVKMLEAKDKYTSGHSERVAMYAEKVGRAMGFDEDKIGLLKKAAEVHDIGKLVIDESILNKRAGLTDEEWKSVKRHPAIGEDILRPAFLDDAVMSVVRSHHEHYDGSGYPDKLAGDHISLFAQIISIADAYDAMTSPRSYRDAMPKEKAIEELKKYSGTQFNRDIVDKFIKTVSDS
jgi:HD-GYP domain-containing protein (c-di-GMP phosphodiesterase class II)